MKRNFIMCVFAFVIALALVTPVFAGGNKEAETSGPVMPSNLPELEPATVYMTSDITPEAMIKLYEALGREAEGKVAVKMSIGDAPLFAPVGTYNLHTLSPDLIKPLIDMVDGTIVEGNTAYGGNRGGTAVHLYIAQKNGYTDVAPVEILDEHGEMILPVRYGRNIKENYVGEKFDDYDFYVVLSHFKGHNQGGFGGAIKNISIGISSPDGKINQHTGGRSTTDFMMAFGDPSMRDPFHESMAEAALTVTDYLGDNILYINVLNNISVDCDCVTNPKSPDMHDIGIVASLDPVAIDQACVDLIYAAPDGASVVERIESRDGIHTIEHAVAIGLGTREYNLVKID